MSPLSTKLLATAFQSVVTGPDFAKKIEGWLISPHAAERWLQFELAYALNSACEGKMVVACEVKRADFAVFDQQLSSPIWNHPPLALMEFKMYGNWYVQDEQRDNLLRDFDKTNELDIPGMALLTYIEVAGCAKSDSYDWCFDQIPKAGKGSFEKAIAFLDPEKLLRPIAEHSVPAAELRHFSAMKFHLLGYRNQLARE
jgi:hypothetical protein